MCAEPKNEKTKKVGRTAKVCPDCGVELLHQSAIAVCPACGWQSAPC